MSPPDFADSPRKCNIRVARLEIDLGITIITFSEYDVYKSGGGVYPSLVGLYLNLFFVVGGTRIMKQRAALVVGLFLGFFIIGFSAQGAEPLWTWMGGWKDTPTAGEYGIKGVASPANHPGFRQEAATWTDHQGRLWLFGGRSFGPAHNDMWCYDPATGMWTWISGSNKPNEPGFFESLEVEAPANTPCGRMNASTWVDDQGYLWMFGGLIGTTYYDNHPTYTNDLWRFNPQTRNWSCIQERNNAVEPYPRADAATWVDNQGRFWLMGGVQFGWMGTNYYTNDIWRFDPTLRNWQKIRNSFMTTIYGEQGIEAPNNTPGPSSRKSTWKDRSGFLWFSDGQEAWRLNPATGYWAWMKSGPAAPVYGTLGQPDPANCPGYREYFSFWSDREGRLWLMGGEKSSDKYNDLWRFDPETGNWTWMKGSDKLNQPGVYGTQGVPDPANTPGATSRASTWTDPEGRFWLYPNIGPLWCFDPAIGSWTWMDGLRDDQVGLVSLREIAKPRGIYGTQGVEDPITIPGPRKQSTIWCDPQGRVWAFGGVGHDANGDFGLLNDLWRFDPAIGRWTWIKGSKVKNQAGSYGVQGVPAPENSPGARGEAVSWTDPQGRFWLFGGISVSDTLHVLNDLWCFDPQTEQWTWVMGSQSPDAPGVYGTQSVAAAANIPRARQGAIAVRDHEGDVWLYGGKGIDATGKQVFLDDLWHFDQVTGLWTWISGHAIIPETLLDSLDIPAKCGATGWVDHQNRLWIFSGISSLYPASGLGVLSNDLWFYDPQTDNWTQIPHSSTSPVERAGAMGWTDPSGRLWLFGGLSPLVGIHNTIAAYKNDLWHFDPDQRKWSCVKSDQTTDQPGIYGTLMQPGQANAPGSRQFAATCLDPQGRFLLWGGWGFGATNYTVTRHWGSSIVGDTPLNDLWRLDMSDFLLPNAASGVWQLLE